MSKAVIAEEPSVPAMVKFLSAVGTVNTASPLFAFVRDTRLTLLAKKCISFAVSKSIFVSSSSPIFISVANNDVIPV